MVLKTAFPLLALLAFAASGTPAWADGQRGTACEAAAYASRETDAPTLQEFSGGIGALLQAIVAFLSNAIQAIVDLFSDDECEAVPPGDQGRAPAAGLPALA